MVLQPPTLPQDLLDQLANANAKIRQTALKTMASLPASSQSNQLLMQTLSTDDHASNCALAAQILGRHQAKEAIDTLLLVLTRHKSKNVRLNIVTALGQLGDRKAVDVLLQTLVKDRGIEVRRETIRVLASWQELRAIPALQEAYEKTRDSASSYHSLCQDILQALGELGGVVPLLPIFQRWSESRQPRFPPPGLDEALASTKDRRIIEPLLELAMNPDTSTLAAIKGLLPFRDGRILPACLVFLDKHSKFQSYTEPLEDVIAYVRTSHDPRLPNLLLARLQDPHTQPRWNTIRLLGEFGEPHMGILLLEHVQQFATWFLGNNYHYGRADNYGTVAETLSKLCPQDTFELLLRLLNAPDSSTGLRNLCAQTLTYLHKKASLEPLVAALHDPRNLEEVPGHLTVRDQVIFALAATAASLDEVPASVEMELLTVLKEPVLTYPRVRAIRRALGERTRETITSCLACTHAEKLNAHILTEALRDLDDTSQD